MCFTNSCAVLLCKPALLCKSKICTKDLQSKAGLQSFVFDKVKNTSCIRIAAGLPRGGFGDVGDVF